MVDLVHSRNSRFLKIEGLFSLDQCKIEEGGKVIPLDLHSL